jgi:hypothetical protein
MTGAIALTEEEAELFLTLKFGTQDRVMEAFDNAIGLPWGYLRRSGGQADIVAKGIHKWVEQGCPDTMDIANEDVEFFLELKFGSVQEAYFHWVRTPPGYPHGLTEKELAMVVDYVPKTEK